MKKILVGIAMSMLFLNAENTFGQSKIAAPTIVDPLTADSLASGNFRNELSSFYQLAFNDLTGPNKALAFTSNPFAIMARADSQYYTDSFYYKYRFLRKFNFNFNLNLDSSYQFNGFNIGFKYALINHRDQTVSKAFLKSTLDSKTFLFLLEIDTILIAVENNMDTANNHLLAKKFHKEYESFISGKQINGKDTTSFAFKDFSDTAAIFNYLNRGGHEGIKTFFKTRPNFKFSDTSISSYDSLVSRFQNRALLTIGANTTYNTNNFTKADYTIEYLKGVINPQQPFNLEVDLKADDLDSLLSGTNTFRNILTCEPGLNLVVKSKGSKKSFLEFKLSGSYYHIFSGANNGEKSDSVTINGVLNVLLYKDIWLPVTIKYDPKTGNVFGFLSVTANFTGITSFFKKND